MTLDGWVRAGDLREGQKVDLEPILKDFPNECVVPAPWLEKAATDYAEVDAVQDGGVGLVWLHVVDGGMIKLPEDYLMFSVGMAYEPDSV